MMREYAAGVLVVVFCAAVSAQAQTALPNCDQGASGLDCTVPAGTYSEPLSQSAGALSITNSGTFQLTAPENQYGLKFFSIGVDGASSSSGTAGTGGGVGYLTSINQGSVTVGGSGAATSLFQVLDMFAQAGNGGSYTDTNGKSSAGNGGNQGGGVYVENDSPITLSVNVPEGGAALAASGLGGDGGNVADNGKTDDFGNPQFSGSGDGGSGGAGGIVTVVDNATISVGTSGQRVSIGSSGFSGIVANSIGGDAGSGSGSAGGASGGAGGNVGVTSDGAVELYLDQGGSNLGGPTYGILGRSVGAGGQPTYTNNENGGNGGGGGPVSVTLNQGGTVTLDITPTGPATPAASPATLIGAGVAAVSSGGAGGSPYGSSHEIGANPIVYGGSGGTAGTASVSVSNTNVSVSGEELAGILAESSGGAGGSGNYVAAGVAAGGNDGNGGPGGPASAVSVTLNSAAVHASGTLTPGIVAISSGGTGGAGAKFDSTFGGLGGGDGGNGGQGALGAAVAVAVNGTSAMSTESAQSPAILALSRSGAGGVGGEHNGGSGNPGAGGKAGTAGDVTVTMATGASISTVSSQSPGIVALSEGAAGGAAGAATDTTFPAAESGGAGGASGIATVTIASGATITTAGTGSPGTVVASASGYGGSGSDSSGTIISTGGNGGAGGAVGHDTSVNGTTELTAVELQNAGSITTQGTAAAGIIAQALSGGGGSGGTANSLFSSSGGTGASAGAVGTIFADNIGTIATNGDYSPGLMAQGVGGGGGAGGATTLGISSIGGTSDLAVSGGTVEISNDGTIETRGDYAPGILAQGIGGGGGDGGSSQGVVSIGGAGGAGGTGGQVTIALSGGAISTAGDLSDALIAQSIGGGGGNAGNAEGVTLGVGVTIGGSGGGGGAGAPVTITASGGTITTTSSKSAGIVTQSIGGGGGSGGAAYSNVVSAGLSVAVAVGGSGGGGGSGSTVAVDTSNTAIATGESSYVTEPAGMTPTSNGPGTEANTSNTAPVDAFGIVAQSIGGGGGIGGAASAQAVAIAVPVPGTTVQIGGSIAVTIGGSGGSGGSGGLVDVDLGTGTAITTYGQGGHGIMAQSIGGGGGTGGDSSAMAATIGYGRAATAAGDSVWTADLAFTLGGKGGVAGNGGAVSMDIGGDGGAAIGPADVTTFGDYADGVLLQSIGGGGGNAGFGSSSTLNFGSTTNLTGAVTLGASGGAGGSGEAVDVTLFPQGVVSTYGSGAIGIAAQSIGGGGGASQGGSIDLGASKQFGSFPSVTPAGNLDISLGGHGAGGGGGGQVTVTVQGTVATQGGDATGVLAQSIGGGGGIGGGAGSDASADNPVSPQSVTDQAAVAAREFVTNLAEQNTSASATLSVALGGTGGAAADGGEVNVTNAGAVSTLGDWASGMMAQSIGGGGGKGGTAVAAGSGSLPTINLNVAAAVGGGGGGGGNGGAVNVDLEPNAVPAFAGESSTITTAGYAAFGLLAQSVGGGGGFGADGSDSAAGVITVGGSAGGQGGGGGSGGPVSLATQGASITTLGENAAAIVLQSIGGGGGIGGNGSSLFGSVGPAGGSISLSVGGGTSSAGSGGNVSVDSTSVAVGTEGANSYGLLAQSVGGGGGLGFTEQPDTSTATTTLGGAMTSGGADGGDVSVTLSGLIFTLGLGSHAIVAQSIGGGGGIAGFPATSAAPSLSTAPPQHLGTSGNGGPVSVDVTGEIRTFGAAAYGILAQSIGAGGGLLAAGNTLYAGSTGTENLGSGGVVTITQTGSITTQGENSVGIFAQSATSGCCGGGTGHPVTITVNGTVEGGSGSQGAGVWVADGFSNGGSEQNAITVGTGGALGALSGVAINYTGNYDVDVTSNGIVSGSVNLDGASGLEGTFINNGSLVVAGPRAAAPYYGATRLNGNFVQTRSGRIDTDVDFASARAGRLVVAGNAALGGRIVPHVSTVLPNVNVPVMIVDGATTGTIQGSHSTLFAYDVHDPPSEITLSARSLGFAPAGFGIHGAAAQVAAYLQPVFDTATTPELGTLFAALGNLADAGAGGYIDALHQLSPGGVLAFASRARAETADFGDALLNCRDFVGTRVLTSKKGCAWMEMSGGVADQGDGGGYAGFTDSTLNYRVGGQAEFAPGWLVGGALGYAHSWLDGDYYTKGEGDAGYVGVSLTRAWHGWRFSGALLGSFSSNSTSRTVSIPGSQSVLNGKPNVDTEAALLRADYTFGLGNAYIRPSMTVDVVRVHAGAFSATGERTVGLDYASSSMISSVFAPEVEFGLHMNLKNGMALQSYLTLGASLPTTSKFAQPVRLQGAALAAGSYEATIPTDGAAATVGVGVRLFATRNFDARLAYNGAFSSRVTDNTGMLVGTLHF